MIKEHKYGASLYYRHSRNHNVALLDESIKCIHTIMWVAGKGDVPFVPKLLICTHLLEVEEMSMKS